MRIEWYEGKEKKNLDKHKLPFTFAEHVFLDPMAVTVYDRYEMGNIAGTYSHSSDGSCC